MAHACGISSVCFSVDFSLFFEVCAIVLVIYVGYRGIGGGCLIIYCVICGILWNYLILFSFRCPHLLYLSRDVVFSRFHTLSMGTVFGLLVNL